MRKLAEVTYEGIEKKSEYEEIINKVFEACFKEESLYDNEYLSQIIVKLGTKY